MSDMSNADRQKLVGVKPQLVIVVQRAFKIYPKGMIVVEGLRTAKRQAELYAQGRTKPGRVVTWTLNSKHITGEAVDLAPLTPSGKIPWEDVNQFIYLSKFVLQAAKDCGVKIVWGANWDGDDKPFEKGESDCPHWQLA